nr:hypothetical protein [Tanacetum cinerariifolium]
MKRTRSFIQGEAAAATQKMQENLDQSGKDPMSKVRHQKKSIRKANVEVQIMEDLKELLHLIRSFFTELLIIQSRRMRNGRLRLSPRNISLWNRNRNNRRLDLSGTSLTVRMLFSVISLVSCSTTFSRGELVGIEGPS